MGLIFQPLIFDESRQRTDLVETNTRDIHVYGFSLDIDESEISHASCTLSSEEQARADRFVSDRHRRHFIVAHAGLRLVLSRYSGEPPHGLVIQRTAKGKPFLRDYSQLRFNLTHSHGRMLIAVAKDWEVGVDLEKIRPDVDVLSLARRFLSDRDTTFIETGDPRQRHERFLQAWIAREAVFKAIGTGMTFPLHGDHFELANNGTEGRLVLGDGKADGAIRPVRFLSLDPGWVGAVAADGDDWNLVDGGVN